MEAFLEAIDQLVTSDRVRELIRRYDLSQAMGDDLSDEGLPREYYLESKMHGVLIRYYEPRLVKTVYLYSGTKDGFCRFQGPLIAGITFQSYRDADPIETRPGFAAMLERIEGNGVRTIIVETANRFARDLMVQEVGFARLKSRGVTLIAADSPAAFVEDTPTARLVRQVLGAIAEFDKAMTVAKLKGARDRIRRERGRCEGRKPLAETHPVAVALAKRLHRASPKNGARRSLRKIAAELAAMGHKAESGKPFNPRTIKAMVDGPPPKVNGLSAV